MITMRNYKLLTVVVVIASLMMSGCDEGTKPQQPTLPAPAPKALETAKSGVDAAKLPSADQLMQGVEYNASGKRDPFVSLSKKADLPKGSLIGFDPGELKLIAVLREKGTAYAVLTTPDAKSFTVRQGTKIGLHGGQLIKISTESVIIREMVKNYKGVLGSKDTVLKLRRGDEQ